MASVPPPAIVNAGVAMPGLLELGEIMVTSAQRRLETSSQNVSNLTTAGYRKGVTFDETMTQSSNAHSVATDFSSGALRLTGQPLDLAITGAGFFQVRGENGVYYTRAGEFSRDAEGRIVDAQGLALQSADGQDLAISHSDVQIAEDGVVIEAGVPIARIGLFEAIDASSLMRVNGAYFQAPTSAMQESQTPILRQGMVEGSNVDLPAEMLSMMATLRRAEAGARVVQAYDTLMGQTISTLGRTQA